MEEPAVPEIQPAGDDEGHRDLGDTPKESGLLEALRAESSSASVPLREDQVLNAVAFLTHPSVVDKNASAKRTFLRDSKGLTDAEIDAAIQRAASQPQFDSNTAVVPVSEPVHAVRQPPAWSPPEATSKLVQPESAVPQIRWTQALLVLATGSAAVYGIGTLVSPFVRRWWYGSEDTSGMTRLLDAVQDINKKQDDTIADVKLVASNVKFLQTEAAEAAAADRKEVTTLRSEVEAIKSKFDVLETAVASTATLTEEIQDMKSMMLGNGRPNGSSTHTRTRQNGPLLNPVPADAPAYAAPVPFTDAQSLYHHSAAPAPYYVQNSLYNSQPQRHINGYEAITGAPPYNASIARSTSPLLQNPAPGDHVSLHALQQARASHESANSGYVAHRSVSAGSGSGVNGLPLGAATDQGPVKPSPAQADYNSILQMLERGETPPGLRKDIVDVPPNPDSQPTPSTAPRHPKPWATQSSSNGLVTSPPTITTPPASDGQVIANGAAELSEAYSGGSAKRSAASQGVPDISQPGPVDDVMIASPSNGYLSGTGSLEQSPSPKSHSIRWPMASKAEAEE